MIFLYYIFSFLLKEEESQKWSKEMNDNMAARAEDYVNTF